MNELLCIGNSVTEVIFNATLASFVDAAGQYWLVHLCKLSVITLISTYVNLHFQPI